MQNISFAYLSNIILNLFVFFLLIAAYSYVIKLENIGCVCSVHPNRDFIKFFSIIAFVFLILITFIPTSLILSSFGEQIALLYTFLKLMFYIICIVYFIMIIDYTRFLVNEKCKCSEDIRRELIMAGSIIEVILLLLTLFVVIILPLTVNSVMFILENADSCEKTLSKDLKTPFKSLKGVSSKLKKAKFNIKPFKK
jgi:hypothetical protein